MRDDRERERLARLRDRQLQTRNPRSADHKRLRKVTGRVRRQQRQPGIGELMRAIPRRLLGAVGGALIGMAISLLLPYLVDGMWGELVGYVAIVVLALFGFMYGQALDVRDDLRDFSRRK